MFITYVQAKQNTEWHSTSDLPSVDLKVGSLLIRLGSRAATVSAYQLAEHTLNIQQKIGHERGAKPPCIVQGWSYLLGQWFSACFVLKFANQREEGERREWVHISKQSTQNLWPKKYLQPFKYCTVFSTPNRTSNFHFHRKPEDRKNKTRTLCCPLRTKTFEPGRDTAARLVTLLGRNICAKDIASRLAFPAQIYFLFRLDRMWAV